QPIPRLWPPRRQSQIGQQQLVLAGRQRQLPAVCRFERKASQQGQPACRHPETPLTQVSRNLASVDFTLFSRPDYTRTPKRVGGFTEATRFSSRPPCNLATSCQFR